MSNPRRAAAQGPSQEFKRRRRAYIEKVRCDQKLPAPAKLICWVISDHWNEESGEAFLSTNTIAIEAGLSPTTVKRMLLHSRMVDHMRIEFGSKGSGNSNRYRPIERGSVQSIGSTLDQFDGTPPNPPLVHSNAANGPFSVPIGPPVDMNHTNHSNNHRSAATPRAPMYADRPVSTKLAVRESAPVGALDVSSILHDASQRFALSSGQAAPLKITISNALSIMPKGHVTTYIYASEDYPAFLASLASVGVSMTASSS